MTRKRRRKRRKKPRSQPSAALQKTLDRAQRLIDQERAPEALALLEPLLASYPKVADLHNLIGYAHIMSGDLWRGMAEYEQAMELSRDPGYWLPLSSLYLQLELEVHALHAFRQIRRKHLDDDRLDAVQHMIAGLEEEVATIAHSLDLPVAQTEKGLRLFEDAQYALHLNDFPACIEISRRAIELLDDWPPTYNNLAMALFFDGQPEKAIETARRVLSKDPGNVQALSNGIRFLAWTGQEDDARALWARLRDITPTNDSHRLKKAEAAAILDEDESVYRLLEPLDKMGPDISLGGTSGLWQQSQLFLAVAEANLGRSEARSRLESLRASIPWAEDLLAALKAGRPGPGWAERFPYFHSTDLVPHPQIEAFVELVQREDEMPPQKYRSQVTRFVDRFPQFVRMGEKMIWEEDQPEAGIATLALIDTPAAHAALRRFGLSQAGDDDIRAQALFSLVEAGQIAPDETLRVWMEGEWRDVQLRGYEISGQRATPYSEEAARALNEGTRALKQGNADKAQRLFQRALELEPRAKEAYNNLGAIHARRQEHERAKEMYRAALEIDPLYVFPRCNLTTYLLDEDDLEGAIATLKPLADVSRFQPQEMAFYSYVQARIALYQEEYDQARDLLEMALKVRPGYELAEDLLEHIERVTLFEKRFEFFIEQRRKRDQAKRARLQTKLSTPEPPLSQALPFYTKDALTGMSRQVIPWGGWSALRKAELIERLITNLTDPDNLSRIVADLDDEDRAALRAVLDQGGHMPWQDFDAEYGNDLEEPREWQWHVPETTMGRLRLHGLLVEATVDDELLVAVPLDLRPMLEEMVN